MKEKEYLIQKGYMEENAKGSTKRVSNSIERLSVANNWEAFKKEINALINPSTYDSFPREKCYEALLEAQKNLTDLDEDRKKILDEIIRLYSDLGIFTSQVKNVLSVY